MEDIDYQGALQDAFLESLTQEELTEYYNSLNKNQQEKMDKNTVFFGAEGITSTKANQVCNKAKEYYRETEGDLDDISLYREEIALIGTRDRTPIETGVAPGFLSTLQDKLFKIVRCKQLIAALREAIKAKHDMLEAISNTTASAFCAEHNIAMPTLPVEESALTEDEYLARLTIKERNEYFELQTVCAVIGSYIHPGGKFAEARKDFNRVYRHPQDHCGTGRDTIVHYYTPVVTREGLENTFFTLENIHRDNQARLNGLVHKMTEAITVDTMEKSAKYAQEKADYTNKMAEINAKLSAWKAAETKRIADLKILIPNSLLSIYKEVESLGKDK